ncbi:MAG: energy transducer TonB [Myxococcota bacterium]|nr:energy transducer TonB [Myxococcales bacterium]
MIPRYLGTAALGALVTFGLFFVMQALIAMGDNRPDEASHGKVIDFVRLKREEQIAEKEREKPELERPDDAPPPPPMSMSKADPTESGGSGLMGGLDLGGPEGIGGMGLGAAVDSEAIPLVRIEPTYPPRAQERGTEGWVEVEFTITPRGTVEEPVVVAYYPSTIFNNAALRAVRRWKYNPKVVDGKPVAFKTKVHLDFELEKS